MGRVESAWGRHRSDAISSLRTLELEHVCAEVGEQGGRGRQDQAHGVVGDVLMIDARRMADLQPTPARPVQIDAIIAGGETGDQTQVRQALGEGLVEVEIEGYG